MTLSLPAKLVILHSALIVLFMLTLWNRWFLTDIPFDCFYAPFFFTSGPVVYFRPIISSIGRSGYFHPVLPCFCRGIWFRALYV